MSRPEDKVNFTLMLKQLRQRLDEEGKRDIALFTHHCSWRRTILIDGTEMGKVQEYLDFINIMTYDFATGVDKRTGHHTHLYESKITREAVAISP